MRREMDSPSPSRSRSRSPARSPARSPRTSPWVGGVAAVGVGAEVVAVQGDVRPPDTLSYCDYY